MRQSWVASLERFEDAHYEGSPTEIEESFGSAHPSGAPGREDNAGEGHGALSLVAVIECRKQMKAW